MVETQAWQASTFSVVALDVAAGEVGVAVASKFLAVGATVPWAQVGAGAVATQAWANASYGPEGLRLLAGGLAADEVVRRLIDPDVSRDRRQVGVVDARGRVAVWTGRKCMAWAGHRTGVGYACQGNLLAGPEVLDAMAAAFEAAAGPLPERLVIALEAGQTHGGDRRGQQAAALLVARAGGAYGGTIDRYVDLRVDNHVAPVHELRALLRIHRLERPLQDEIDAFVVAAHHDLDTVRSQATAHPILVHARARWEENAIEAAAHSAQAAIAEFLLSQGAALDICTAAMLGMGDRVEEFLRADPSLVAAGAGRTTPLHGAAVFGQTHMVAWLLEQGADINARDTQGRTPLSAALGAGHREIGDLLRQHGALE